MSRTLPILVTILLTCGGLSTLADPPAFVDVTELAGLDHRQHEAREPPLCFLYGGFFCEPERMSGGAAAGDFDNDGWIDLYVTRLDQPDLLFRNRGDGTFENVTLEANLSWNLQSNGASWSDIDNDGDLDLYVTTIAEDRFYLFVNDGRGRFDEQAVERGADVPSFFVRVGYSVTFGDYDRDGFVDIHINEWRPNFLARGGMAHARLLRNRGADAPGHFEDVTVDAGVDIRRSTFGGHFSFASSFSDLDDDGWPDLPIAADFGTSRLFWNNGDGTFSNGTVAAGVGTDENGMGSTIADYDGDGRLDWFVTSIYDPEEICRRRPCNWGTSGNRMYRNLGERRFEDSTDEAGVRNGWWGWGAAFFDYDNDGDQDLAMTNGVDFPGLFFETPYPDDPMRFWRNDGGTFTDISDACGANDERSGKGLLTFDYDNDGDLDMFITNNAAGPLLLRNDGGNDNGWLRLDLIGTDSNRESLNARVEVQISKDSPIQIRELGTTSDFLGQSERTLHFGAGSGDAPIWSVRIRWPASGRELAFRNVPRNRTYTVVEPVGRGPFPARR